MGVVALIAALAASATGHRPPPRRIGGKLRQAGIQAGRPSTVNCTWGAFAQQVDHFGPSNATFPQRYCIYDAWWKTAAEGGFDAAEGAPGPILFYTGNESPVEEYINDTGLMWELGESMSALLIFVEHRYEPLSHPAICGAGTQQCFAYCTTAQANADWASVIEWLRTKHAVRAPAVALGGSCVVCCERRLLRSSSKRHALVEARADTSPPSTPPPPPPRLTFPLVEVTAACSRAGSG
jgi:hypothetical protein